MITPVSGWSTLLIIIIVTNIYYRFLLLYVIKLYLDSLDSRLHPSHLTGWPTLLFLRITIVHKKILCSYLLLVRNGPLQDQWWHSPVKCSSPKYLFLTIAWSKSTNIFNTIYNILWVPIYVLKTIILLRNNSNIQNDNIFYFCVVAKIQKKTRRKTCRKQKRKLPLN